jgi:hypothetical protein
MSILVQCPNPQCQKKSFRVRDEYAGKRVKCPICAKVLIVPSPSEDDFATFRGSAPTPAPDTRPKKASVPVLWISAGALAVLALVLVVIVLNRRNEPPKQLEPSVPVADRRRPQEEPEPEPKPEPEKPAEVKPDSPTPMPMPEAKPEEKKPAPTMTEEKPPEVKPEPMPVVKPPETKPVEVKPEPTRPAPPPAQPPVVKIARSEPVDPRVGESLHLDLTGTHPEKKPLTFHYRSDPKGEWAEALGGNVVITGLKRGTLTLEFRAEDGAGGRSEVVTRSWEIKAAEPPPKTVGGVVQLTKIPPVRTDNKNTLVKEYGKRFIMSASSTWSGWPTSFATDDNIETSWFSAQDDSAAKGRRPWLQAQFPEDVKVKRVTILGNRDPAWLVGYTILSGTLTLYDAKGRVLRTIPSNGTGNFRDFDFRLATPVEGVRYVRFTSMRDQGNATTHGDIGIAEMQIE